MCEAQGVDTYANEEGEYEEECPKKGEEEAKQEPWTGPGSLWRCFAGF
jgi:hypothetical protein